VLRFASATAGLAVPSAKELIAGAVDHIEREVPSLSRLKLVIRLELRGRGDVQVFRVAVPGPRISKGEPDDARLDVAVARSDFNELATEGGIKDWREAYEHGRIKVGGDSGIQKLIGTVIDRQMARAKLKKTH
jgi:hypothetical protein